MFNGDAAFRGWGLSRRRGQAVLVATLVLFVLAALGAGFIVFVQNSINVAQRVREEEEALVLAQAGLAFADSHLSRDADWRPSILVTFDDFERLRGWNRPDRDGDWYGKYAARQIRDLLGNIGSEGAFLLKVKFLPDQRAFKIISIGRPRHNSPVYRRLVAFKPLPHANWLFVTGSEFSGRDGQKDPLLLPRKYPDPGLPTKLYEGIFTRLGQIWDVDRDTLVDLPPPAVNPLHPLYWFQRRSFLSPRRLPVGDKTFVFAGTIRVNSDLEWYGDNFVRLGSPFVTILEVARRIQHETQIDAAIRTQVLVYDFGGNFHGFAVPSDTGTPLGSGFLLFPIDGIPRYLDGWERLGRVTPIRWSFNFPRRTEPFLAPPINPTKFRQLTRDADLPPSRYGYHRIPDPLRGQDPVRDDDPTDDTPIFPTFGFHVLNYYTGNPNEPQPWLIFRGIYIDNTVDRQFPFPNFAPDVDGDRRPDQFVFTDEEGTYRPELAQVFDWHFRPPLLHPRRGFLDNDGDGAFNEDPPGDWDGDGDPDDDGDGRTDEDPPDADTGWFLSEPPIDLNALMERNIVEGDVPLTRRFAAPTFYVPPGVEVRFDVVLPDPVNTPTLALQRIWLIRHDLTLDPAVTPPLVRQTFRAPDGTPLPDNPATPLLNEGARLVFIDPVQLLSFDDDDDGLWDEDPINFRDDDGDGRVDEDPFNLAPQDGRFPHIVVFAEGNIRVSGQVIVSVTLVTPETIYIEGPLHPLVSNATLQLLAKRNICLNLAAAQTPLPSESQDPRDRTTYLPRFGIFRKEGNTDQLMSVDYPLPNNPSFAQFSEALDGSLVAIRFPKTDDDDKDGLVDDNDAAAVTFGLITTRAFYSDELQLNLPRIAAGEWTFRLVLLHRGRISDENGRRVLNPWTNLQVEFLLVDPSEPANTRSLILYGPAEPFRSFPQVTRWYDDEIGQGEWGILDIPIPPAAFDLNGDGLVDVRELLGVLTQRVIQVRVISPVPRQVIPQGRSPVRYELGGIKIALYDERGLPRPIWQSVPMLSMPQPPHPPDLLPPPIFVQAFLQAERGTFSILSPGAFDPTAHPSWQRLSVTTDPTARLTFVRLQRLWSLYYLRFNAVRWAPLFDARFLPLALARDYDEDRDNRLDEDPPGDADNDGNLDDDGDGRIDEDPPSLHTFPILIGNVIERVTPQTMLTMLGLRIQSSFPSLAQALTLGFENALDKSAIPYPDALPIDPRANPTPVFIEIPHFSFDIPRAFRRVSVQAILNRDLTLRLPDTYRSPLQPRLSLPRGFFAILQQQVGRD